MSSIVILMMSIIAIFAIPSEAASIRDYEEFPGSNIVKDMCPTVGLTAAEYQVSAITEMSSDAQSIGGCAFINFKSNDLLRKSFNLWIGSLNNGMRRCREEGMEHFNFSCLSESSLMTSEEYMKGVMFVQLFGRVNNKENKPSIRCAIHDMVRGNATKFRMAISGDDSCHGLADLLQSNLQTSIPKGAIVLQLNRAKLIPNQLRVLRSTSNGNANITNHFSEPRYFWQMG